MISAVFMRPKPRQHVIDIALNSGKFMPGTISNPPTSQLYTNAGLPFPGIWKADGIGAGGGGGGQDTYYSGQPGQGGLPGGYGTVNATLGVAPLAIALGTGGTPGANSSTTPTSGGYGGGTGINQNSVNILSCAGGAGGLFGTLGSGSGRDPVPPSSVWPGNTYGRGGYGSQNLGGASPGNPGNIRLTLIG